MIVPLRTAHRAGLAFAYPLLHAFLMDVLATCFAERDRRLIGVKRLFANRVLPFERLAFGLKLVLEVFRGSAEEVFVDLEASMTFVDLEVGDPAT